MTKTTIDTNAFEASLNDLGRKVDTQGSFYVKKNGMLVSNRTIGNIISRSANGGSHLASTVNLKLSGKEATISVEAPYALYVEEGTSKMRAKHFLRDAVDAVADGFVKDIKRLLE